MPDKKQTSDNQPAEDQNQSELEERVKQIMEPPDAETPQPIEAKEESASTPESAPVVADEAAEPAQEPEKAEEPDVAAATDEPPSAVEAAPPEAAEDDAVTEKAVDDIVTKESDDLLAAEDEKLAAAFALPQKAGPIGKLRAALSNWWRNPEARKATLAGLGILLVALLIVPNSRYFFLNAAGVRAAASVTVLDGGTMQPLKNVDVRVGDKIGQTDSEGTVRLDKLKLGRTDLIVEKRAFAPINRKIVVGWGSNPMGEFDLTPVGSQHAFVLTDFLSGKPVVKAEASSGEASAVSDDNGRLVLTIDKDREGEVKVTIDADTYRQEELVLDLDNKADHPVKLAPARQHVFVSKRSGKFDVYKIGIDGKNEQLVLSGTGSEQENMALVQHPTEEVAAFVSTRGNERNRDGFLLSTLTLIEMGDRDDTERVAQSERIQLVDWIGDRLVYVQIASGASASDPNRHRLMSYDYKTGDKKELASSNYFNDVIVAGGQIYYAASAAYQDNNRANFSRVDANGENHKSILDQEVWNIFRTEYDRLSLSVQQEWYEHELGSDEKPAKMQGPPAVLKTRIYRDNPGGQTSLWVDNRDGKGVLLAFDLEEKTDDVLRSQSGLRNPVRWLTERVVIYRINTDGETADYALSLDGGDPVKISDVTNTRGVEQLYY